MKTQVFVSGDGLSLTADVDGPEAAPIVLLLHGGGQTRHSWSGAMTSLVERGYRVINCDARGHGDSEWSEHGAYSLDDRVEDVRALLGEAPQPYAIVGASLGGATAIRGVAQGLNPAAIVLVDIVPHPEPQGVDRIVNFMRAHLDGFASLEEAAEAVAAYNPDRPKPRDPRGLKRNLRLQDNGRLRWHWDPRIVETRPEGHQLKIEESAEALARNDLPVLLVRGLQSDVVSEAGVAAFRKILPSLEVADVSGAGHMVAGDKNDAFNQAALDFLSRHLPV